MEPRSTQGHNRIVGTPAFDFPFLRPYAFTLSLAPYKPRITTLQKRIHSMEPMANLRYFCPCGLLLQFHWKIPFMTHTAN